MSEPTNKPTWEELPKSISDPRPVKEAPKSPSGTPTARAQAKPKILWKAVEPRHYLRAQGIKAASGKAAYSDYVVSLVERFEGESVTALTKTQTEAIVSAFEEKYGEAESK